MNPVNVKDQCSCGATFQARGPHPDVASIHREFLASHAQCRRYSDKNVRDAIRSIANRLEAEPPDRMIIQDDAGTVTAVVRELRALLGEDESNV